MPRGASVGSNWRAGKFVSYRWGLFLIVQIQLQVDQKYPDHVSVADIFANPTIAQIAKLIDLELAHKSNAAISNHDKPDKIAAATTISDVVLDDVNALALEQLSAVYGISMHELMLSVFMYAYAEVTSQDRVSAYVRLLPNQDIFLS